MYKSTKQITFFFLTAIFVVTSFVLLILFTENEFLWYGLLAALLILQIRIKDNITVLFPLLAVLTLTEFYFIFSDKRVYLCELLYLPLFLKYFFIDFFWKKINYTKFIIAVLALFIIIFQTINLFINSDFASSVFRVRSLVLPLFLIMMVESMIKNKNDLQYAINLILIFSFIGTVILYLQFFTGKFYILQNGTISPDDLSFIDGYLTATQDSFLFKLLGLNIKGPMPPIGLNYFKFGYSEKIIVPVSLLFAYYLNQKKSTKVYLTFFLFLVFATVLTGSRSVLLTFLFVMLIMFLFKKKMLKWSFIQFTILFFFAATYLISPLLNIINLDEFGTLISRMFYMEDFFSFIGNYPNVLLAGSSPSLFLELAKSEQPPHHFFAFGVVYDGLIITSLMFYLVYKLLKSTYNLNTSDIELATIGQGLWASIFGFVFIYGQTSYLTWNISHNMFFCIVIGLLIATKRIAMKEELQAF